MDRIIITITGPTCSGKTTLQKIIAEQLGCCELVSTTTRPPRDGEVNGKDYHFVSQSEFQEMIEQRDMIEHTTYDGHHYGTSRQAILGGFAFHERLVTVLNPDGVKSIKDYAPRLGADVIPVFVLGKTEVLLGRLYERHKEQDSPKDAFVSRVTQMMYEQKHWEDQSYYQVYLDETQGVDEIRQRLNFELEVIDECKSNASMGRHASINF